MQDNDLEFTGERFMPGASDNISLEHTHRYRMALHYAKNKDVLDIASGEGYGSSLLAGVARSVVGVDISEAAVRHAQKSYRRENLEFRIGSCTNIPLPDHSLDLVVSFETLEHIDAHEEMLSEVRRVLRPGGCLIISTPEKAAYTDATGLINPFHVKELYRDEFTGLMARYFRHVTMHSQRIGFGSIIACDSGPAPAFETDLKSGLTEPGLIAPHYLIAVASDDALAVAGVTSVFSQEMQSSEPVLKRVEFERAGWEDEHQKVVQRWSKDVAALQRKNWQSRASLSKLLHRLIMSRVLYRLSSLKLFSERRRNRFARSAEKRDPLLLVRHLDHFCAQFFRTVSQSEWMQNGRSELNSIWRLGVTVTAIVPNYNHARYLRQRLDSILAQTYPVADIVILDDASTDDSRQVIEDYSARFPNRIRTVFNDTRSGNVFDQWKKGHEAAKGDLVWICESDDFCEPDFVEKLIPLFSEPSVMMAFGRIQFADEAGTVRPGLDQYRESAEAGIWAARTIRPARQWFAGAFGVKNVIANVGGSIWRRFPISNKVWETAKTYKIMGDWYLYSVLPGGGQIGYEPAAVSYFRIHDANLSVEGQKHPAYYKEYAQLVAALRDRWDMPDETLNRFLGTCRKVFRGAAPSDCNFDQILNRRELRAIRPGQIHVLMGFAGFSYGGGEVFPIHLANALHRQGVMVSMLQVSDKDNHPDVRQMLDPGIPVYTAQFMLEMGIKDFLQRAGVSIVHSHQACVEMFLLDKVGVPTPYIATLHGSYEAMEIPQSQVETWAKKVRLFAYTAERNLEPFRGLNIPQTSFRKFHNAMPLDELPFPSTRAELGIADDAIVFALVARGVEGKGWSEAVRAFVALEQRRPEQVMALLMVGEGEEVEKARALAAGNPRIRFLGFQQCIHGFYRLSDVALAPTRFSGESFPLCLIQSMQVGTPVIATDIGEIKSMLGFEGKQAGIVVPYCADTDNFVSEVSSAMEAILDPASRRAFAQGAHSIGETFGIDALGQSYRELYSTVLKEQA